MRPSINVWHCCGKFGYALPWAEWQAAEVPVSPINWVPEAKPGIYLYSRIGQDTPEDAESIYPMPPSFPFEERFIGAVCVDEFVEEGAVNWDRVYAKLREVAGLS